jgi:hypothetical protein
VVIAWDGDTLSSNDDGSIVDAFQCDNPANGDTCVNDEDCQEGFACDQQGVFGGSGQCIVGCRTSDDCGQTQECNADHDCVLASTVFGWKEACENDAQCEVGFHCDFLTRQCEEECAPGCNPGTDCCELSGGDTCTPDPFFQVFGNCDP